MEFVHPERLWLLLFVLIPILIHFFHFRKRKTLFFSSLRFIQFLEKQEQSTRKLKHYLLLASRILAISFIVLAFANPFTKDGSQQKGGKEAIVIYLDNSFSMTALGTEGTLLSEGRELAKRILGKVKSNTRVLICSNHLNSAEQYFGTKAEALSYLDQLEPFALSRSLDEIVQWEQKQIKQHEDLKEALGNVQRIFISDFQKHQAQLQHCEPEIADQALLFQLQAQNASNVFIDSVWFANPTHQLDANQELFVRVKHSGEANQKNLEVNLEIGGMKRTMFLKMGANQKQEISFPFTEKNKGKVQGNIRITDSQIHFDDQWFFAYEVAERTEVCLIEDQNSSPKVAAAFAVEPRYQIKSIAPGSANASNLGQADLIVVNGLNEVPNGLRSELIAAQARGQKLLLIPGAALDLNNYNLLLKALGFPSFGSTRSTGIQLQEIAYNDPFFRGVFEKKIQKLQTPIIAKHYQIKAQNQSLALPLLKMRSGQALFLRAQQQAFLWSAALDPSFGSLAQQSLFPTILLRCGEFASQRFPLFGTIGQDAQIGIRAQISSDLSLKMRTKDFEFIPQFNNNDGIIQINLAGPAALEKLKSGIYQLEAQENIGLLALNYPRTESVLEFLNAATLLDLFRENGIKNCKFNSIKEGQSLTALQIDQVAYYWRILLFMALLFLLTELALLKWWK